MRQLGAGEAHMAIDSATAEALELIHPIRVGTCSSKLSGASLFRWALAFGGGAPEQRIFGNLTATTALADWQAPTYFLPV